MSPWFWCQKNGTMVKAMKHQIPSRNTKVRAWSVSEGMELNKLRILWLK